MSLIFNNSTIFQTPAGFNEIAIFEKIIILPKIVKLSLVFLAVVWYVEQSSKVNSYTF